MALATVRGRLADLSAGCREWRSGRRSPRNGAGRQGPSKSYGGSGKGTGTSGPDRVGILRQVTESRDTERGGVERNTTGCGVHCPALGSSTKPTGQANGIWMPAPLLRSSWACLTRHLDESPSRITGCLETGLSVSTDFGSRLRRR